MRTTRKVEKPGASQSGSGQECPMFKTVKEDKNQKASIGFTRRKLLRSWAKAVLEKRLERKAQCDGGENVEGRTRDRDTALL